MDYMNLSVIHGFVKMAVVVWNIKKTINLLTWKYSGQTVINIIVKPVHAVTSIKQSPALKGHLVLMMS